MNAERYLERVLQDRINDFKPYIRLGIVPEPEIHYLVSFPTGAERLYLHIPLSSVGYFFSANGDKSLLAEYILYSWQKILKSYEKEKFKPFLLAVIFITDYNRVAVDPDQFKTAFVTDTPLESLYKSGEKIESIMVSLYMKDNGKSYFYDYGRDEKGWPIFKKDRIESKIIQDDPRFVLRNLWPAGY